MSTTRPMYLNNSTTVSRQLDLYMSTTWPMYLNNSTTVSRQLDLYMSTTWPMYLNNSTTVSRQLDLYMSQLDPCISTTQPLYLNTTTVFQQLNPCITTTRPLYLSNLMVLFHIYIFLNSKIEELNRAYFFRATKLPIRFERLHRLMDASRWWQSSTWPNRRFTRLQRMIFQTNPSPISWTNSKLAA